MRQMNFCEKWVKWIDGCISFTSVSVLVNGSPSEEFIMARGIRQGDPLALFLFQIVAEGLNGLVGRGMEFGKLIDFRMGTTEVVEVAILQF